MQRPSTPPLLALHVDESRPHPGPTPAHASDTRNPVAIGGVDLAEHARALRVVSMELDELAVKLTTRSAHDPEVLRAALRELNTQGVRLARITNGAARALHAATTSLRPDAHASTRTAKSFGDVRVRLDQPVRPAARALSVATSTGRHTPTTPALLGARGRPDPIDNAATAAARRAERAWMGDDDTDGDAA